MGRAMEIISGYATNPSTTLTGLTMMASDSATVRSFPFESGAFLEDAWTQQATKGALRIKSPRLHDNLYGINVGSRAAIVRGLLPDEVHQRLYPQDNLTLQISGGGSETDQASFLMQYNDLPGVNARLYQWDQVEPLIKNIVSIQTVHTLGSSATAYQASQAINATQDTLKANEDYAILGYITDTEVCSVGWKGSDTGNLRVGGPGCVEEIETRSWFRRLDQRMVGACIPVINAANKQNTFVDLLTTVTSGTVNVFTIMAELGTIS